MNLRAVSPTLVLALTVAGCNQILPQPERAAAQDQAVAQDQAGTQNQNGTTVPPMRPARGAAAGESSNQPAAPAPRIRPSSPDSAPATIALPVAPPVGPPPASVTIPVAVVEDTCSLLGVPQRVTTMTDTPAFIGPLATQLPLVTVRGGTRLQVLSRTGDWLLVQFVGREMLVDGQVAPAPRQGFMNCNALITTNQSAGSQRVAGTGR